MIAVIAAASKGLEQLTPLSNDKPTIILAKVPMTAAVAIPVPIWVAEKYNWLKTNGVK